MDKKELYVNPLTGRAIKTSGATYKKLMEKEKKTKTIQASIKSKKAQSNFAEKKEASKVLQGVIKRTLAKKPEPPKPETKKFGFEDLPEDLKVKISGMVRGNLASFEKDKREDSERFLFARWASNIKKRLKTDINSQKDIDYVKEVSKKKYGGDEGGMGRNPVPNGIKGTIIVKTYTRKERVEKLRDLSKKELDKKGGMKHYPLLCFTIIVDRGYRYLGEDHYINNPPTELWIRGRDAETCFKDGREYSGVPYFLFPDGFVYETDLYADTIFEGTLSMKENLFGNDDLKIEWGKVDKKDRENKIYDKVKSKYLPNFYLPIY